MSTYKAFVISLYEDVCIVKLMNRVQSETWLNGESEMVCKCKTCDIRKGDKVVDIFIDTDNNFSVSTI